MARDELRGQIITDTGTMWRMVEFEETYNKKPEHRTHASVRPLEGSQAEVRASPLSQHSTSHRPASEEMSIGGCRVARRRQMASLRLGAQGLPTLCIVATAVDLCTS